MNRWVLLEHQVSSENLIDIHYDFLIEDDQDCLTWKFFKIPILNQGFVEIVRQPNHRLVWLSRTDYVLSGNRGFVKRIDCGNYLEISCKLDFQDISVILDGVILNGLLEISGNFCRLNRNI